MTSAGGATPPPTILAVDDDDSVRELLVVALRRAGFDVVAASNAEDALEIINVRIPDLVLCDVGLPGTSGVDLVRQLRAREDTATLPVILITGSGDSPGLVAGLNAGADDFLGKPVRMDELVARVRTHLRAQAAWSAVLRDELSARSGVIDALASLRLSGSADETAEAIVRELVGRTGSDFVSILRIHRDGRIDELATYSEVDGVRRGGERFQVDLARYLLGRAEDGPWVDDVRKIDQVEPSAALRRADVDLVASAPIVIDGEIVAMLSMGSRLAPDAGPQTARARLLSATIDYAHALGAMTGSTIAGTRERAALIERIEQIIETRAFHPVVQPILQVEDRRIIGYEALTRFEDGMRPDLRFGEAAQVGLGGRLELAALTAAADAGRALRPGAFLSLNVAPSTLIEHTEAIRAAILAAGRDVVLELTEHVPIDDYVALRTAIERLGPHVTIAVDDAGAGFASLRHILELRPAYTKLDISLVRGIDTDELRQAAVAGLIYYALRTGCLLIAEGVETEGEHAMLKSLGVDLAQGYLYGRPAPVA